MNGDETMRDDYITPERRAEINQRKTMLEKRMHHKSTMPLEDMVERDDIAKLNRDGMISLIELHKLFIPRRDMDRWRPTVPTSGTIDGYFDLGDMLCIATDGLQAYFILPDGRPWLGHVQMFHWNEPVVSYVPYMDEHGNEKFFKSVKDQGAPSALYRKTPKPKKIREKVKRAHKKSKRQILLESL